MLGRSSPEDKIQIAERTSTMTRVKMQEWASLYCRTPYLQATRHERGEMADILLLNYLRTSPRAAQSHAR